MRTSPLLLALLGTACSGGAGDRKPDDQRPGDSDGGPGDVDAAPGNPGPDARPPRPDAGMAVHPCIDSFPACSAAPLVGVPGETAVDTLAVQWSACTDSNGDSLAVAPVTFRVPADIAGLSLTIPQPDVFSLFWRLEGPTRTYVQDLDSLGQPPLKHYPGRAATVTLPMSATTYPEPGCWHAVVAAEPAAIGRSGVVEIVSRRGGGQGALGLNVIIGSGVDITQQELDAAFDLASQILADADAAFIDELEYYAIDVDHVSSSGDDLNELRAVSVPGGEHRLNLFLVASFTDAALYGIAGGVPGPLIHGTDSSGVVVAVDTHRVAGGSIDTQELAATIVHEAGHQLGLHHTSEADGGAHDLHTDTPECDASRDSDGDGTLYPGECYGHGHDHTMFWTSEGQLQDVISPSQSDVIFYSPIVQ